MLWLQRFYQVSLEIFEHHRHERVENEYAANIDFTLQRGVNSLIFETCNQVLMYIYPLILMLIVDIIKNICEQNAVQQPKQPDKFWGYIFQAKA